MLATLTSSPSIGTRCIQRCDPSRVILIDDTLIQFTPTEYRLLAPLLQGGPVADSDLAQEAYSCQEVSLVRENLDKHFDKIRYKLRAAGLNVHRVAKYGYILLDSGDQP